MSPVDIQSKMDDFIKSANPEDKALLDRVLGIWAAENCLPDAMASELGLELE
jgi:hypothetical protein